MHPRFNKKLLSIAKNIHELPAPSRWELLSLFIQKANLAEIEEHEEVLYRLLSMPYPKNNFYAFNYDSIPEIETELSQKSSMHHFEPAPMLLLKELFDAYPIPQDSCFVDLGGGIGKVNVFAALHQPRIRKNICIELNAELIQTGANFIQEQKFPFEIEYDCQDILSDQMQSVFPACDYAFHYQVFTMDAGSSYLIDQWVKYAQKGAVLIAILPSRFETALKNIKEITVQTHSPSISEVFSYQSVFIIKKS